MDCRTPGDPPTQLLSALHTEFRSHVQMLTAATPINEMQPVEGQREGASPCGPAEHSRVLLSQVCLFYSTPSLSIRRQAQQSTDSHQHELGQEGEPEAGFFRRAHGAPRGVSAGAAAFPKCPCSRRRSSGRSRSPRLRGCPPRWGLPLR